MDPKLPPKMRVIFEKLRMNQFGPNLSYITFWYIKRKEIIELWGAEQVKKSLALTVLP